MSLLNQVLQDLEQGKAAQSPNTNSIFDQIKAATPNKSNNSIFILLIIIVLIAFTFVLYEFTLPPVVTNHVQPIKTAENTNIKSINMIPITASSTLQNQVITTKTPLISENSAIETLASPTTLKDVINNSADTKKTNVPITKIKKITDKIKHVASISKPISQVASPQLKVVTEIIETPNTINKKVSVESKPPSVEIAPKPAPKNIIKITTLSPEQKADRLFVKAQKTLHLNEKHKLLQQGLALNPSHIEAHVLLAHTYLQQGSINKAIVSLEDSLQLIPRNSLLTRALANLLLKNKQGKEALNLLLNINSHAVKDERLLNLLAAAYQQNKLAFKAGESYKKLLDINPDKAEYWLGLAVSLEDQKRNNDALVAYRKSLNLHGLKPAVISYIKQRMNSLN